ncbi:MAG TPA: DUF2079 domain-containing protein [Streptosporangiaceae bacterium]|nr:DUF2079 domain-containing protein [Streptosporangiaceae bacterium]
MAGQRAAMDPVTWIIALATFIAYDTISVFRYLRLDPGSWDLGIFTEYVKQLAGLHSPEVPIRGAGFNLLGDHFQPIVGLLAPLFRVFPTPETLLVAQALLTAASVIPVCRAAQELLGTWASRGIGLAYGFSWGLQQMVNFDFHEIAFAVPLLAFSLSALVRRRLRPAVLWALPLVFVKEDQGFTVAAIGLVMAGMGLVVLARGGKPPPGTPSASPGERPPGTLRWLKAPFLRHRAGAVLAREGDPRRGEAGAWVRAGILLAAWGLAWSVLAIAVIIPHFNPMHHYPYWYDGGVVGPGGHPSLSGLAHQVVQSGHEKLWTTFLILLPVAFLALRSPLVLIALPSLALRFISTNNYFWGTSWHYDATVMPIVFLAAVDGMARFRASSQRRALLAWAASRPGAPPVLARRGDPPEPPAGLRPGSSVTGPGPVTARRRGPAWLPAPGEAVARYGAVVMVVIAGWLAFRFPLDTLWSAQTYDISSHVRAEDAAVARVPDGVTVEATLTMLAPLAARDDTYWIGITPNPAPDYVVFDETDSGWSPPPANALTFIEQRHPGWAYLRIFTDDGVDVFRRAGRTGG